MARLIYTGITSLNGYLEDSDGMFDWAEPDEEVHTFINDLERPIGTHLCGRRMYEVMAAWDSLDVRNQPPFIQDFAEIWKAADKIVYSKTLRSVSTARTRIERAFAPEMVRRMKEAAERDMTIGGPQIAAQAFEAGLVDACHLFITPIIVGSGKCALPSNIRLKLELEDERRFGNDMVYLGYRTAT